MQDEGRVTIQTWRVSAIQQLNQMTSVPEIEADSFLRYVLSLSRAQVIASSHQTISETQRNQLDQLLQRRMQREPLAYILGKAEFWSLPLTVSQDVLVPRPETELLVEWALKLLPAHEMQFEKGKEEIQVADLGTGSGCIALSLASEKPNWKLTASDISAQALAVAKQNASDLGLSNIDFYLGSWCEALPSRCFHAIVSNPPYLSLSEWENSQEELHFEPKCALLAKLDGLADFIQIAKQAMQCLHPGGFLLFEHGAFQGKAVRHILQTQHFVSVQTVCDLAGHERVSFGQASLSK